MRMEIRTLARTISALAFAALMVVAASAVASAQERDDRYRRQDNGLHRGWYVGQQRGRANRTFRREERGERRAFRRGERSERRTFRRSDYNRTDRRAFNLRERQERATFNARQRTERRQYRRDRRY